METVYILLGGKPVRADATITGEYADIPLPFGGVKRVRWPNWYPSEQEALEAVQRKRQKRIEAARKLLATDGA